MASTGSRVAVMLWVVALTVVGVTGTAVRADAATCAGQGDGHVAVVVDFGVAPGAPDGLLARCVSLVVGARGGDALSAAAGSVGRDSSGKVCQIAGFPARYDPANCSAPHDGTVAYWSYFHGTAEGWTYSNLGDRAPANRVRSDVVEGWRFVELPAGQSRTFDPPRNFSDGASYRWQSTCSAASVTTPPPPPPTTPGRPSASGAPTVAVAPTTSPVTPTPSSVAPSTSSGALATTTSTGGGLHANGTAPRLSDAEVTAAARAAGGSSPGSVAAIVAGIVGLAVVALGSVLLTHRSRRRRRIDEDSA